MADQLLTCKQRVAVRGQETKIAVEDFIIASSIDDNKHIISNNS